MAQRVFLDVGAHLGETLAEALNPRWRFDRIIAFEPAPPCWPALQAMATDTVELYRFGLWNREATQELHDPGDIGASIWAEKAKSSDVVTCHFRDVAAWFSENIDATDTVFMKVNCEGAECDLLDRLLETGELTKVDHLLVHFDVEKIPSMTYRANETRVRLDASGVEWREARSILFGRSHARKTANWLAWCDTVGWGRLRYSVLNRAEFRLRQRLYPLKRKLLRPDLS